MLELRLICLYYHDIITRTTTYISYYNQFFIKKYYIKLVKSLRKVFKSHI
jgi:hypothetical protein